MSQFSEVTWPMLSVSVVLEIHTEVLPVVTNLAADGNKSQLSCDILAVVPVSSLLLSSWVSRKI